MSETIMSKALGILCDRCEMMSADCAHYPCELYVEMEQLLSAQPEIIRCGDCKYWQDQREGVVEVPICARPENKYEKLPFRFMIGEDGFCSFAERKEN